MACRRVFCRARISAQECPDYSTMTERALHEKVWCSCCTQGLDNDMTVFFFLNNCNCWNCHILFQTSYFFYSLKLSFRQGLLVTRFGSRYGESVQRKQTGFEVISGMVHSALAGIFKRSRSDGVVMFLVDGQKVLPQRWWQNATSQGVWIRLISGSTWKVLVEAIFEVVHVFSLVGWFVWMLFCFTPHPKQTQLMQCFRASSAK